MNGGADWEADLPAWTVGSWRDLSHLRHGFLGRSGGVSDGPFASLNLSFRVGDDPQAVAENHRRVRRHLRGVRLLVPRQVHGDVVQIVDRTTAEAGEADAVLTEEAGLAVGVLTADCVPILLVAPEHHVAGAVHAGWKGTAHGIAARALEVMRQRWGIAPESVRAAIGPAIGPECYEVGSEVIAAVARAVPEPQTRWTFGGAHRSLDLIAANRLILERCGVPAAQIWTVGPCTRCAPASAFSHRRAGGPTGRQLSFVAWQQ